MIQTIANLISVLLNQAINLLNFPILPGFSISVIVSVALFLIAISFIMRLLI